MSNEDTILNSDSDSDSDEDDLVSIIQKKVVNKKKTENNKQKIKKTKQNKQDADDIVFDLLLEKVNNVEQSLTVLNNSRKNEKEENLFEGSMKTINDDFFFTENNSESTNKLNEILNIESTNSNEYSKIKFNFFNSHWRENAIREYENINDNKENSITPNNTNYINRILYLFEFKNPNDTIIKFSCLKDNLKIEFCYNNIINYYGNKLKLNSLDCLSKIFALFGIIDINDVDTNSNVLLLLFDLQLLSSEDAFILHPQFYNDIPILLINRVLTILSTAVYSDFNTIDDIILSNYISFGLRILLDTRLQILHDSTENYINNLFNNLNSNTDNKLLDKISSNIIKSVKPSEYVLHWLSVDESHYKIILSNLQALLFISESFYIGNSIFLSKFQSIMAFKIFYIYEISLNKLHHNLNSILLNKLHFFSSFSYNPINNCELILVSLKNIFSRLCKVKTNLTMTNNSIMLSNEETLDAADGSDMRKITNDSTDINNSDASLDNEFMIKDKEMYYYVRLLSKLLEILLPLLLPSSECIKNKSNYSEIGDLKKKTSEITNLTGKIISRLNDWNSKLSDCITAKTTLQRFKYTMENFFSYSDPII